MRPESLDIKEPIRSARRFISRFQRSIEEWLSLTEQSKKCLKLSMSGRTPSIPIMRGTGDRGQAGGAAHRSPCCRAPHCGTPTATKLLHRTCIRPAYSVDGRGFELLPHSRLHPNVPILLVIALECTEIKGHLELQEDEAEHRRAVFTCFQIAVGAQLVGGGPQVVFEFLELFIIHGVSRPASRQQGAPENPRRIFHRRLPAACAAP